MRVASAKHAGSPVAMATGMGMGAVDAGRSAIVATELARNLLKHAGGGAILIGAFEDETGAGVECIALDSGPGIADIAAALRDGYSTAGTSGTGLGAVRRLSHDFDHYSRPGLGSAILSRVRPGEPRATTERKGLSWGGVSLAKDGEDASGDAWRVKSKGGDLSIFVVDGLGHGPMAAKAAHAAIGVYDVGLGRADARYDHATPPGAQPHPRSGGFNPSPSARLRTKFPSSASETCSASWRATSKRDAWSISTERSVTR